MPGGGLIIEMAPTAATVFQFFMLEDEFGNVKNDVSPILLWECVCTFEILKKKIILCLLHMYFKIYYRGLVTRCRAFVCYWRNRALEKGW